MTVLVFGHSGQVAVELRKLRSVTALGRAEADLVNPERCAEAILRHKPSIVINAAAYTAVDAAEDEEALATVVNGDAPTAMAQACAELDIPFIHLSTDYVFDGSGDRAWSPSDGPQPQNAYGRSKLAGELGVSRAGGRWVVLRTSWVFSATGSNFVKTMLRLSETRDRLNIVADQIGGPTGATDIAAACLSIADQMSRDPDRNGVFHFSGAPDTSWAEFAKEIYAQADRSMLIQPISSAEYPTPAQRPLNSRLDCMATEQVFGVARPDWRKTLHSVLNELGARQT